MTEMTTPAHDPYTTAAGVLTRLTLDLRAAFARAHDADSRAYAFGLAHLVRDLTDTLAAAAWTSPAHAGHAALGLLSTRTSRTPDRVPDWLRVIAATW